VAGLLAARLSGGWAVAAVTGGAAVAVVVLLPTVMLLFPALGMAMGGAAAFLAVLLGLAALPVVDLLHPQAGGQVAMGALRARRRAPLPAVLAFVAFLALAAVGLRIDRFDAAHPSPTHLMYALDADTGRARWLSAETSPQPWTARYVSGAPASVAADLPAFGAAELLTGPATAAALPAPLVTVLGDTRDGDLRTLRLRLVPQRPSRFVTLHSRQPFVSATVAGRPVPAERGLGFIFHAPPAAGVEVTVQLTGLEPVRLRAMDASDGLAGLPGFQPRPADVGIVGSHTSEMVAVTKTYTF
jgi:hypothetical protein